MKTAFITTFGTGGKVITSFGNLAIANTLALQQDGKAVVGGFASNGSHRNWTIARYNTNGSLDSSFGVNGIVTKDFGYDNSVQGIGLQKDGKVIVGGTQPSGNGSALWTISRYNTDGSVDTSFGNNGLAITGINNSSYLILLSLKVQPDNKIVTVGYIREGNSLVDATVARYNPDGTLDQTFGTGGIVTSHINGSSDDRANTMALHQDGKIVIFGDYDNGIFLYRYNTDGSLDNSFGSNGLVTDNAGLGARGVAIQADGKIVVTGPVNNPNDTFVIRYNSNGSRDNTFANNGLFVSSFSSDADSANSVVIRPDGKIVLGGYEISAVDNHFKFALRGLNSGGTLDTNFGTNGSFIIPTGSLESAVSDIALQNDGKVMAVGVIGGSWGIARYADSTPDLNVPALKQTSSPWGAQIYDGANNWSNGGQTITDWGCALTSDVMILQYHGINKLPDGTLLDPGTLNIWLKSNNGYDDGINNGYIIPTAISTLSKLAKSINNISSFDALETNIISGYNPNQLTTDINNSQPDVLGVSSNSHYVIAKGINGSTFNINDPYFNRNNLNDGYNNTFASLTQYVPSFTDLSYIFISATPNTQLLLKDSQNNSVGQQMIQPSLTNESTGTVSGQNSNILFLHKPPSGNYQLVVSGSLNQKYKFNLYLYDKNGNIKKLSQQGTVGSTTSDSIDINFDNQNASNSGEKRIVTFQSTIDDINENRNLSQIGKLPANALLALIVSAKKDAENGKKFNAKVKLDGAMLLLNLTKNKGVSDTSYQILIYDFNYLKTHL